MARGRNPSDVAKINSRVVVKRRVEQSSWPLLLVCVVGAVVFSGRGQQSFAGLLMVVVVEQPGSWARGFRVVGSSPTVVGWSRCDRTRRKGTQPGSVPPDELSASAGGPNKDPTGSISFGCVCVCVCVSEWALSLSRIAQVFSFYCT